MLNYETLLSTYDDKLTLMQWLKKVEKALANASASSFEVVKTGNATIRFRINFEDGTYLESGDMVLQQGESVSSGEIRNGHLYLTLTNGQELDCGELFNGEVPSLEVRSLEVTGGLLVGDDANMAIGGDLVVHGLTEVQNILAYGHVETDALTAAGDEISAQKPVVEVMTGYSFTSAYASDKAHFDYAGVCKNGNKVTFVQAGYIESDATLSGIVGLGGFVIPSSIGAKIFPIGETNNIDIRFLLLYKSGDGANSISSFGYSVKENDTFIRCGVNCVNPLTANIKYYFRYELTFLLSENLAA